MRVFFSLFFSAHQDNVIDLEWNPLDCNDCRMYWLLMIDQNNDSLQEKIFNAYCGGDKANGTIWDHEESLSGCRSDGNGNDNSAITFKSSLLWEIISLLFVLIIKLISS